MAKVEPLPHPRGNMLHYPGILWLIFSYVVFFFVYCSSIMSFTDLGMCMQAMCVIFR